MPMSSSCSTLFLTACPVREDPRAQFLHGDARVLPEFFDDPHIRCIYLGLHTASALPRHLPG